MWACKTAIQMQDKLDILRKAWQEEGDRWPEIVHNMQNRIGICTGHLVTGNMGSEARMNYTMMGDTVNLAARLESSAKQYGVYIQISDTTYKPVKDLFVVRDLDFVVVKGKTEPAQVYELISEVGKEPNLYKKLLPAFHEALALYRNQDWKKAIKEQHIIVHLAAETGTGQSMYEQKKYEDVNINGTANMLELLASKNHKVEKIIIASSRAVYGEGKYFCLKNNKETYPKQRKDSDMKNGVFHARCQTCDSQLQLVATDENSKINPSSFYGKTKEKQEKMVMSSANLLDIAPVAFRYQNVYGPGQSLLNPYT